MIYFAPMAKLKSFKKILRKLFKKLNNGYKWSFNKFEKKPLTTILVLLCSLLALIILGNILRSPQGGEKEMTQTPKKVEAYQIQNIGEVEIQGEVEKSGIITITAQTTGIVNKIHAKTGEKINAGKKLVSLSTNYQGASSPSVQRQIAGVQYQNTKDTYETQKDLINKQKDLAVKQDENADELREISDDSIGRTEDLISLNENILSSIDSNIKSLESSNTGGVNDDTILSTKQLKSQVQSGLNQLKSSLDNTRYQSGDNKTPAEISNLTKDITLIQLELQEKALDLSLKTSGLQLQLANIQESLMFPASPINATVERVFVKEGQIVNPGTPLMVINGSTKSQIIARVPFDLAQKISQNKPSIIYIDGQKIEIYPSHISSDATDGSLSSLTYELPDSYQEKISNKSFLPIKVMLEVGKEPANTAYLPIDALHTLTDKTIIYVIDNNLVKALEVKILNITGLYAEVENSDLIKYNSIILTRNVTQGEKVYH